MPDNAPRPSDELKLEWAKANLDSPLIRARARIERANAAAKKAKGKQQPNKKNDL